uniref:Putative leucine-rich repeat receptor-like protein kinase At5g49770 n=1 Tax=Anthurium amnicola TaxID=1678845 RepID=A0A1D1YPN3_9ARAE
MESELSGGQLPSCSKVLSMRTGFRFRRRMGSWCCTCLLMVFFHFPVILALTNSDDAVALTSLGYNWKNKPFNWIGSDPCGSQWVGISCMNSSVVSITLSSMGLKGTITGDIQYLTALQTLDLSYNVGLTGNLPASIGNLRNLTNLILVGCSFSGEIPDLGALQRLVFL